MAATQISSRTFVRPVTGVSRARASPVGLPGPALRARSVPHSARVRCQASAREKSAPSDDEDMMDAMAKGGELGILEGRTGALIHPAIMFFLFFATGYTGYLGYQWRRVREIGDEITTLKATIPAVAEGAVAAPPSEAESKVAELTKTRKDLVAGGFKDKHFNWGSLLLGLGVAIAIEGPVNTYIRTGKLFPGPHLYAGAAIAVLWALAASLVPAMQKGNSTARTMHIGLNCINLGLFAWQVPTGIEIVLKVFQFTSWP